MITDCNTAHTSPYATKGLANGLGIPALVTGGLALLSQFCNGNGFFGITGCGNQGATAAAAMAGQGVYQNEVCKLRSENAALLAEQKSDAKNVALYQQTLADNKTLRDEFYEFIRPIAQESASNRERVAVLEEKQKCEAEKAALREELLRKDVALAESRLNGKIDTVAQTADCCCKHLSTAIAGLQATMGAITTVRIPNSALCPGIPPVEVIHPTTTTASTVAAAKVAA